MKKLLCMFMVMFFALMVVPDFGFAEDAPAAAEQVVAESVEVQKSGLESAVGTIQEAEKKIPVEIPAWLLGSLIFAIELGARAVPTSKPKSLLLLLSQGLSALGSILTKLSALLDKLLQNLK